MQGTCRKMGITSFLTSFLLSLLLAINAKAEYNGYFLELEITTTEATFIGHVYVAAVYIDTDSFANTAYLKKAIDRLDRGYNNDTLEFYRHRLTYGYHWREGQPQDTIYTLVDADSLPLSAITQLKVVDQIDFGYLLSVSTPHTLADTSWMRQQPEEELVFDGYLCSWDIAVFDTSPELETLLAKINLTDTLVKHQQALLEEVMDYSDGHYYYAAQELQRDHEESLDNTFWALIKELFAYKVVVVAFCSC